MSAVSIVNFNCVFLILFYANITLRSMAAIDIEKILWPRPSRTNAELLPPPLLNVAHFKSIDPVYTSHIVQSIQYRIANYLRSGSAALDYYRTRRDTSFAAATCVQGDDMDTSSEVRRKTVFKDYKYNTLGPE